MTPAFILTAALLFPANAPERVTSPADYVALVAADLATVPEERQAAMYYVVIPPWMEPNSAARAVTYVMNATGRAKVLVHPRIATDKYLAFDLFELAGRNAREFVEYAAVVSEMTLLDPRFYTAVEVLPTKPDYPAGENVNHQEGEHFFDCPFCGKRHKSSAYGKLVQCIECEKRFRVPAKSGVIIKTGRQLAPHLGLDQVGGLVLLSGSPTPIISADVLISHAFTQIDDVGFYYRLKGIDGLSFDDILKRVGANLKLSEDTFGVLGAMMNCSGVTKKNRVAIKFQGAVGDVTFTFDFADNADFFAFIDNLRKNPFYFTLDFEHQASEAIWEEPNSLHGFGLFDGDGNIADEAPFNIANSDNPKNLPRGGGFGTNRLQVGIDCFICHGKGTFTGMQPLRNALAAPKGFDIFDDESERDGEAAVERLASLFGRTALLNRELDRIRDDYSAAIFSLVREYDVKPETEVVNLVSQDVAGIWYDYTDLVDARRMLLWAGLKFESNEDAAAWLRLQPLKAGFGSAVARLRGGQAIQKNDAAREFAELAFSVGRQEGVGK